MVSSSRDDSWICWISGSLYLLDLCIIGIIVEFYIVTTFTRSLSTTKEMTSYLTLILQPTKRAQQNELVHLEEEQHLCSVVE